MASLDWSVVSNDRAPHENQSLLSRYRSVRRATESLCEPLIPEDYVIQSMPDVSPVKWHLAHTTWFFETFVLQRRIADYRPFDSRYGFLFNSYYTGVGPRWPRAQRGLLSRPGLDDVIAYREHVDRGMERLLDGESPEVNGIVELGLNHEQQHQELILTDLKHAWSINPLHPVYRQTDCDAEMSAVAPARWLEFPAGLARIGHEGIGFAFDNELPRHTIFLNAFQLSTRLVTNAEYLDFIADSGYQRPELWLSDGWATVDACGWTAPLYWERREGAWFTSTLSGLHPVADHEPVCHVSFYEADAFARWAGSRLPIEAEWEAAAAGLAIEGHFLERGRFHPAAGVAPADAGPFLQMYGDVWQWTASPYLAYPGFRAADGALGEYNGKFMCNQFVLRGASCATPRSHARRTYRNFFAPDARWQFTGIRLAKELA